MVIRLITILYTSQFKERIPRRSQFTEKESDKLAYIVYFVNNICYNDIKGMVRNIPTPFKERGWN